MIDNSPYDVDLSKFEKTLREGLELLREYYRKKLSTYEVRA